MDILIKVFALQLFVAVVVVFVLKQILEKDLVLSAIERAQGFHPDEEARKVERIDVILAREVPSDMKASLAAALREKCPRAEVVFSKNAELQGGLVVKVAQEVWDHSLATRIGHLVGKH